MSSETSTRAAVGMYAFRSTDPRRLATFWAEVMDLPVSERSTDDLVMLDFDHEVGPVTWMFHRDDAVGDGASRIGLDIGQGDEESWREIADRAERAGAVGRVEREYEGVRWIELDDPDGNAFRVFAPRPA